MTEKEYREKHREMWGKIIKEYKKGNLEDICVLKMKILKEMGYHGKLIHGCFTCDYCRDICNRCPILYTAGHCVKGYSVWKLLQFYLRNKDQAQVVRLAEKMRDAWE